MAHFSSFSARPASLFPSHPPPSSFFPPLSRFLPPRSLRRRVLSSCVFNAQANVIVTFRRPCAKRAHKHRLMRVRGDTLDFIARCNSEIYRGVRVFAAGLRCPAGHAIRQVGEVSLVNHTNHISYRSPLCRTNRRDLPASVECASHTLLACETLEVFPRGVCQAHITYASICRAVY